MEFDYQAVQSVQVRDGVVTQEDVVWWHGEDGAELINLKAPGQLRHEWENIVDFPLVYSLNEPSYELDNNGYAVYDYKYPYND